MLKQGNNVCGGPCGVVAPHVLQILKQFDTCNAEKSSEMCKQKRIQNTIEHYFEYKKLNYYFLFAYNVFQFTILLIW